MGTLFLVATPIGNLDDISQRALKTLADVDLILAEDTRRTGLLIKKFSIQKPLLSFHDHNELSRIPEVLEKLKSDQNIALVSDAGTPAISDPGFKLIRECSRQGIKISPIPGPSAVITALSASALPTDSFAFLGYVPKKEKRREEFFNKVEHLLSQVGLTVIFFETPHRISKTLDYMTKILPNKDLVVTRELTKINEDIVRGKVKDLSLDFKEKTFKGEFTLLIH